MIEFNLRIRIEVIYMAEQLTPEGAALRAALEAYDNDVTEAVADLTGKTTTEADQDRKKLEEASTALGKPGLTNLLDLIAQAREQKRG
jgi:hypothetical protein